MVHILSGPSPPAAKLDVPPAAQAQLLESLLSEKPVAQVSTCVLLQVLTFGPKLQGVAVVDPLQVDPTGHA